MKCEKQQLQMKDFEQDISLPKIMMAVSFFRYVMLLHKRQSASTHFRAVSSVDFSFLVLSSKILIFNIFY